MMDGDFIRLSTWEGKNDPIYTWLNETLETWPSFEEQFIGTSCTKGFSKDIQKVYPRATSSVKL